MKAVRAFLRMIMDSSHPMRRVFAIILKKTRLCQLLTVAVDGFRIRFYPSSQSASAWYDPRPFRSDAHIIRQLVRPGTTCVDVGANVGLTAIPMALATGKEGRVLAFEANPEMSDFLTKNMALNGVTWAEVRTCALGAEDGLVGFSNEKADDMNHVLATGERGSGRIAMQTLDGLAEGIGNVQFLKMDVEGFELEVVRGGRRVLGQTGIIYIEVSQGNCSRYGYAVGDLLSEVASLGFVIYRCVDGKFRRLGPDDRPGERLENLVGLRSAEYLPSHCCLEFVNGD